MTSRACRRLVINGRHASRQATGEWAWRVAGFRPNRAGATLDANERPPGWVSRTRQEKEDEMKLVVIGGTGLIGSKLVEKLREDGHKPLAASPDTGVNPITGEGLAEAL